ncbi:hypothetical protein ACQP2T_42480 [Nonomuraea sp. CA-143628]|uniref:hypothetical protein n=1 Tax=Nonomuraea sp. CA-143628 TaxID=3239997 RepID=UPI003D901119
MTLTDESRPGRIVAVPAFGGMVVSMMLTLVAAVIPKLPELLSASVSDASWVVTATLLSSAVFAYLTEPIPTERS